MLSIVETLEALVLGVRISFDLLPAFFPRPVNAGLVAAPDYVVRTLAALHRHLTFSMIFSAHETHDRSFLLVCRFGGHGDSANGFAAAGHLSAEVDWRGGNLTRWFAHRLHRHPQRSAWRSIFGGLDL